jgi:hypothetical protein
VRGQPRRVPGIDLDLHEHEIARVVEMRALPRRLQQRGQEQGRRRFWSGHAHEHVHPVAQLGRLALSGRELGHEREEGGDAGETVAGIERAHHARGGEDDARVARQGQAETMEGTAAVEVEGGRNDGRPRDRGPAGGEGQADSSSSCSRPLVRAAKWPS